MFSTEDNRPHHYVTYLETKRQITMKIENWDLANGLHSVSEITLHESSYFVQMSWRCFILLVLQAFLFWLLISALEISQINTQKIQLKKQVLRFCCAKEVGQLALLPDMMLILSSFPNFIYVRTICSHKQYTPPTGKYMNEITKVLSKVILGISYLLFL